MPAPRQKDRIADINNKRYKSQDKIQHVLLSALRRIGASFSSMSSETFLADNCVIGERPFPAEDAVSVKQVAARSL
jgi:hypothetical protein